MATNTQAKAYAARITAMEAEVERLTRERALIHKRLRHTASPDEAYRVMDWIQQGWRDITARLLRREHRKRQQAETRAERLRRAILDALGTRHHDFSPESEWERILRAGLAPEPQPAPERLDFVWVCPFCRTELSGTCDGPDGEPCEGRFWSVCCHHVEMDCPARSRDVEPEPSR